MPKTKCKTPRKTDQEVIDGYAQHLEQAEKVFRKIKSPAKEPKLNYKAIALNEPSIENSQAKLAPKYPLGGLNEDLPLMSKTGLRKVFKRRGKPAVNRSSSVSPIKNSPLAQELDRLSDAPAYMRRES